MFDPHTQLEFVAPYKATTKPVVLAVYSTASSDAVGLIKQLTQRVIYPEIVFASLDSFAQVQAVAQGFPNHAFACDQNQELRRFIETNEPKIASVFHCFILQNRKLIWKGGFPSTDFDYWVSRVSGEIPRGFSLPDSRALGPYSPGVSAGGFLFISGQLGMQNGKLVGGVVEQTRLAICNAEKLLRSQGSNLSCVCKTSVALKRMEDFAKMNAVYAQLFAGHKPARICVQMAKLPAGADVEIEFIAVPK